MFRYTIYGRTENENQDILKLAGTNDLEDAKQIIFCYYSETDKEYFIGSDIVVTFGIFDEEQKEFLTFF